MHSTHATHYELPQQRQAVFLKGLFSPDIMQAYGNELQYHNLLFKGTKFNTDTVSDFLEIASANNLPSTAFVVGTLATMVAQQYPDLNRINREIKTTNGTGPHRDMYTSSIITFIVVQSGTVDMLHGGINIFYKNQHLGATMHAAETGDVLALNNIHPQHFSKPLHSTKNATGRRLIFDFTNANKV